MRKTFPESQGVFISLIYVFLLSSLYLNGTVQKITNPRKFLHFRQNFSTIKVDYYVHLEKSCRANLANPPMTGNPYRVGIYSKRRYHLPLNNSIFMLKSWGILCYFGKVCPSQGGFSQNG